MKKALVTLLIGERYEKLFNKYVRNTFQKYCKKYGYDLLIVDKLIDNSERAIKRSPAWQKRILFRHEDLKKYERVVWVDSDVLINPESPDISLDVPLEKIGAVDAYSFPTPEIYRDSLQRLYNIWGGEGGKYIDNLTPQLFHTNFGLDNSLKSAVQSGVMVMSPKYHKDLLEHVYNNYEDKGDPGWNYEMRPLSYEIQKNNFQHWIDPRFNIIWVEYKNYFYPFLNKSNENFLHKMLNKTGLIKNENIIQKCATTA